MSHSDDAFTEAVKRVIATMGVKNSPDGAGHQQWTKAPEVLNSPNIFPPAAVHIIEGMLKITLKALENEANLHARITTLEDAVSINNDRIERMSQATDDLNAGLAVLSTNVEAVVAYVQSLPAPGSADAAVDAQATSTLATISPLSAALAALIPSTTPATPVSPPSADNGTSS